MTLGSNAFRGIRNDEGSFFLQFHLRKGIAETVIEHGPAQQKTKANTKQEQSE